MSRRNFPRYQFKSFSSIVLVKIDNKKSGDFEFWYDLRRQEEVERFRKILTSLKEEEWREVFYAKMIEQPRTKKEKYLYNMSKKTMLNVMVLEEGVTH